MKSVDKHSCYYFYALRAISSSRRDMTLTLTVRV